jgi:hypothetical protein
MAAHPVAGFYVAWGRWLDCEFGPDRLYKVGHTGDLGRRLTDSDFTTCFPAGMWCYRATFELPSKEDAQLLETEILYRCRQSRLGERELVRMGLADIVALAATAATELGLEPILRNNPEYLAPASSLLPRSPKKAKRTVRRPTAHEGPDEPGLTEPLRKSVRQWICETFVSSPNSDIEYTVSVLMLLYDEWHKAHDCGKPPDIRDLLRELKKSISEVHQLDFVGQHAVLRGCRVLTPGADALRPDEKFLRACERQ